MIGSISIINIMEVGDENSVEVYKQDGTKIPRCIDLRPIFNFTLNAHDLKIRQRQNGRGSFLFNNRNKVC